MRAEAPGARPATSPASPLLDTALEGVPHQADRSLAHGQARPPHITPVDRRRPRFPHVEARGPAPSTIPLLELEPDLAGMLTAEQRSVAAGFRLPLATVTKDSDLTALIVGSRAFGALVLDGLLLQTIHIGTRPALRLIGPGALVPLNRAADWMPLARSRLLPTDCVGIALLGRPFLVAAHRWPQVVVCLHGRMLEHSARLATQLAICQLPRVQDRVLAMLGLLAESWGRVTPDGISLQLALTHETLAGLIGARRPSVSLALKDLAERNAVVRRDNEWLITGR